MKHISIKEASDIFGLSEQWLRKDFDEGNISGFRLSDRGKRFLSYDSCRDRIDELKRENSNGQVND